MQRNVGTAANVDPTFTATVEAKTAATTRRVATLAALRKARGRTHAQFTQELDMTQGEISRLERRENLLLATMARFIEATRGYITGCANVVTSVVQFQYGYDYDPY